MERTTRKRRAITLPLILQRDSCRDAVRFQCVCGVLWSTPSGCSYVSLRSKNRFINCTYYRVNCHEEGCERSGLVSEAVLSLQRVW